MEKQHALKILNSLANGVHPARERYSRPILPISIRTQSAHCSKP